MAAGDRRRPGRCRRDAEVRHVEHRRRSRPFNCALEKCERWHAGIDLTGAPDGATIVAPEDALVVGIDRGWSEGSKAAFLRTKTGLFLVLGGFKAGSHKEFGIQTAREVRKGEKLGRVLGSYGMIHLETYAAEGRTANSVWWKSEPPPDGLQNPTNYVERMVGDRVSLVQTRQRHEALAALGYFAGDVAAGRGAPPSEAALRAAQTMALGVDVDGKWGPKTEDAIQRALGPSLQGCSASSAASAMAWSGSLVGGASASDRPSATSRGSPCRSPWWRSTASRSSSPRPARIERMRDAAAVRTGSRSRSSAAFARWPSRSICTTATAAAAATTATSRPGPATAITRAATRSTSTRATPPSARGCERYAHEYGFRNTVASEPWHWEYWP
jgi:hypothetical protein